MTTLVRAILLGIVVTLAGIAVLVIPRASDPQPALAGDVLPPKPAPAIHLRDQFGHVVSLTQFKGHPVLVLFMQSNCTGLCPLATETVHRALAEVGPAGRRVAVVAISVDPEGDTPASVVRFSRNHGMLRRWHYLVGSRAQLTPVWKRFYIYAPPPHASQAVEQGHTSAMYLLDDTGKERALAVGNPDTGQLVHNLRVLLHLPIRAAVRSSVPAPEVGHPAPDFTLTTLDGRTVHLSALHRPVLLNFWATWCIPCKTELPLLERWSRHGGRSLDVIGIDQSESRSTVAAFARGHGVTYPVAIDASGDVGARYNVYGLPVSLLVDAHGIVQVVHVGAVTRANLTEFQGRVQATS